MLSEPQRALLSTITAGHEIIHIAESELTSKAQLPELGNDPASLKWIAQTMVTHKQNVGTQIAEMNAATAQVVTLTSGSAEEVDHTAVGEAISTIATNLPEMTKGVRMIAALMEDDTSGDRLLDAARKLCTAFSDLLKATEPETKEVSNLGLIVNLLKNSLVNQYLLFSAFLCNFNFIRTIRKKLCFLIVFF